ARYARGLEAPLPQALQVVDDIVRSGLGQTTALVTEEVGEIQQIAAIRGESISGRSLLGLQGPEILNHHVGHRVTTSNLITAVAISETDVGAWCSRVTVTRGAPAVRGAEASRGVPAARTSRVRRSPPRTARSLRRPPLRARGARA